MIHILLKHKASLLLINELWVDRLIYAEAHIKDYLGRNALFVLLCYANLNTFNFDC